MNNNNKNEQTITPHTVYLKNGGRGHSPLQCLPYAYLLGMPKCGSSDLWERLVRHPEILPADRKEVRFFTPGEFASIPPERGFMPPEKKLSEFTMHHGTAADQMYEEQEFKGRSRSVLIIIT
jgi:hypothetical protein